ncbi:hypothetical protein CTI12_AA275780 [Artemisia annua]|uniref:Uncharacterized protein n=1 Tax=Artemisia annua TaxID=35608 RepID=A0A2U1NEN3_ARTAN|nr:hypothetical protein CTI12_AA275780 [Artemisia annua]
MEKLVSDYFEKSVKGLGVCNAIRDGIEQIRQLQAIGNNIVAPKNSEIIATNGLAVVVYTMSNVFLFVMWAFEGDLWD